MPLNAGDEIKHIMYTNEAHRSKWLKIRASEDTGVLKIFNDKLLFEGKKASLTIRNIISITRAAGHGTNIGDWIQITYRDQDDIIIIANFIKYNASHTIFGIVDDTNKLYKDLLEWNVKINEKNKESLKEPNPKEDINAKLLLLKDLLEKQLITEEEYKAKKENILSTI